jgi:hypothetical protein
MPPKRSTKTKEDYPNQLKWKALFRGSLLSTTINKHVSYVGLADRRAQGIITLNALLVPVALNGSQNPLFVYGAIATIISAFLCITAAFISLYPKKYSGKKEKHAGLLHFSQIQKFSEKRYLDLMNEALQDTSVLAKMASRDLYHISKRILHPKFRWLKISYLIFLSGNFIALILIAWQSMN